MSLNFAPQDDSKYPGFVRTEKEHREVYKQARNREIFQKKILTPDGVGTPQKVPLRMKKLDIEDYYSTE